MLVTVDGMTTEDAQVGPQGLDELWTTVWLHVEGNASAWTLTIEAGSVTALRAVFSNALWSMSVSPSPSVTEDRLLALENMLLPTLCIEPGIATVVKAEHPVNVLTNAVVRRLADAPLGAYPASIVTEVSWVHPLNME